MSEANVTGAKQDFFGKLPNYLINDLTFSANAMAVALYLESKPGNWICHPNDIRKRFGWGRHTWLKVSRELKERGLLIETKIQHSTELRFEISWNIMPQKAKSETMPISTRVEIQTVRNSDGAKIDTLSNKDSSIKIDLLNNKHSLCESEKNEIETIFEQLWEGYPLKKAKQKALEAFKKVLDGKAAEEAKELLGAIYRGFKAHLEEHNAKQQLKQQGAEIWIPELPHLSTWLNQRRWEDGYQSAADLLATATKKPGILDLNQYFKGK